MSRIATLTAVLCMLVASSALAAPADYRSSDPHGSEHAAQTQYYAKQRAHLPSSHANLPSPAVVDSIVPPAAQQPAGSDGSDVSVWAVLALIAGGLAAFAAVAVVVRRHYQLGPPAKA